MAAGRADLSFKWNAIWLLLTLPAIAAGSQFGASGLAWAILILVAIGLLPNWYFLVRPLCGAGLTEYSVQLVLPLLIAFSSAVGASSAASAFADPAFRLATGLVLGGLAYALLSWWFNRAWVNALVELVLGEARSKRS
jgi:hypothetical protein